MDAAPDSAVRRARTSFVDCGAADATIQVKSKSGKPVENASVIVKFVNGHSVAKLGKHSKGKGAEDQSRGQRQDSSHSAGTDFDSGDRQGLLDVRRNLRYP
jgi:hypothetical protein